MQNKFFKISSFIFLISSFFISANPAMADDATISVFAVILSAPANLSATVQSSEQINLSWDSVSGAVSYNVYQSGLLIASVSITSYSVTGLSAGTLYSFTVSAVDGSSCESVQSAVATATTSGAILLSGSGGGDVYFNLIIPSAKKILTAPEGGFKILINNGAKITNNASVSLQLAGGPNATKIELSNDADFKGSVIEDYSPVKNWVLSRGDGKKEVYARFLDNDNNFSPALSANIILDSTLPSVSLSGIKSFYSAYEDVILAGQAGEQAEIIFYWDQKYGIIKTDISGAWTANLGLIKEGSHSVIIMVKDSAGNLKTIAIEILVREEKKDPIYEPEKHVDKFSFLPFIFENIEEKIKSAFRFVSPELQAVEEVIIVSRDIPKVLGGKWNLLPVVLLSK